jgi:hypothetical protein
MEKAWMDSSFREYAPSSTRKRDSTFKESEMTDWTKEEDEAFNAVEQQSNLGKQILKAQGQPYHFDTYVSPSQRNHVLEEVALEFDKMPFGDTAHSFAAFVRGMKQ